MTAEPTTSPDRDQLVADMRAAANRAFPKDVIDVVTDDPYRARARRLARWEACAYHALGRPVVATDWADLTDPEIVKVTAALERVAAGTAETFLRTSGTYALRPVAARRRKGRAA